MGNSKALTVPGVELTSTGLVFGSKVSIEDWEKAGEFLARAEGAVQWWIGDWLLFGEGRPQWGDKYQQAVEKFGIPEKTLKDYKWVAMTYPPVGGKLSERSDNLSWNHHRVAASQTPKFRKAMLVRAEADGWSVSDLRKEIKRIKRETSTPELPTGKYRVIYADPPWEYNDQRTADETSGRETGAAVAVYDTMPTPVICALHQGGRSVQDLPAKDSALFLWATAPTLPDAMQVMAAWGFAYKAQYVWDKVAGYNGHYNDVQHELLLIGLRGDCQPESESLYTSVITVAREGHSQKPAEFYEIIETMYPTGPYLEMFARKPREGWDVWGNQLPDH